MLKKSVFPLIVSILFAFVCNCIGLLPSHACCQTKAISSQTGFLHSAIVPHHSETNHAETGRAACCQGSSPVSIQAAHQPFRLISLGNEVDQPTVFNYRRSETVSLSPQLLSFIDQRFVRDVSKRRCREFCVLLN